MQQPKLPLPAALRGSDRGSFTERTMKVRIPSIGRRVLAENAFTPEIVAQLEQLVADVPLGKIRPLTDATAPDATAWQAYVQPYVGQDWLTVPWFFAELYFFRRVLEATGYFLPKTAAFGVDPYAYQKRRSLETSRLAIQQLAGLTAHWLDEAASPTRLAQLLSADMWGNQADMGLWSADDASQPRHTEETTRQAHLLADDRPAVVAHLLAHAGEVVFVADNAGLELVGDLVLADYLLQTKTAVFVTFHLKNHPIFVSDATIANVRETITFLQQDADEAVQALGLRLEQARENGRLRLTTHPFWTAPLPWWELPADLDQQLATAHLVISKGDANYRRLLGDRHWPFTTPFAAVVSYPSSPLVALRTLKSEVVLGLSQLQVERLNAHHDDWLVGGKWGVIQFSATTKTPGSPHRQK